MSIWATQTGFVNVFASFFDFLLFSWGKHKDRRVDMEGMGSL